MNDRMGNALGKWEAATKRALSAGVLQLKPREHEQHQAFEDVEAWVLRQGCDVLEVGLKIARTVEGNQPGIAEASKRLYLPLRLLRELIVS